MLVCRCLRTGSLHVLAILNELNTQRNNTEIGVGIIGIRPVLHKICMFGTFRSGRERLETDNLLESDKGQPWPSPLFVQKVRPQASVGA